jgi:uncharacterized repeat protein (TIGR01451 family)
VLYSTTAGDPDGANNSRTFTDLTNDSTEQPATWCAFQPYFGNGCAYSEGGIHPDEHVIAVNPSNPTQIFEGSDGGMIRTSGAFADTSSQCDEPHRNGGGPLPTTSGSYLSCKRLLSRVPTEIDHIDANLSSTLQFYNVAIDPFDTCDVLGGTQDNGTWSTGPNCNTDTFTQVIYGDGGNAIYDSTHQGWMANEFTGGFGDVNFENGDPTKWVISTGPIVASGEAVGFYWPQIADPNPPAGAHPIFEGFQHVWRSWAFGAGHTSVPQQTTPDIAYYEANCPEFVTSGASTNCGDYQPLGGPAGTNQPGDLTGTAYGSDRTGGSVSALARDGSDTGTMWAATSAGRIFVTHNVDAVDPATIVWHRIDNSTSGNSPTRFPSGITIDPADPGHAWISYSGYDAATPATPGHVFEVSENGTAPGSGTFTNLDVEAGSAGFPTPNGDGDLPVADIVRDDATHTLYVATDFGVLRGDDDGHGGWFVTAGLPRYEVTHLEMEPSSRVATCVGITVCPRVLYAATQSQGIWKMKLPSPDLAVSKTAPATVVAGKSFVYTLRVVNKSSWTSLNPELSDELPAGTTFVSLTQTAGPSLACVTPAAGSGGTVDCSTDQLAPRAAAKFTLVVKADPSLAAGSTISNTATVSSTGDIDSANNEATAQTTVTTSADLGVTNAAGPATVARNHTLGFTVRLVNHGPSDAQTVDLSDQLPAGTTFESATQTGGAPLACTTPSAGGTGTVDCSTSSLASGASATIKILVRVTAASGTTISDTATASSATSDPASGNDSATASSTVS